MARIKGIAWGGTRVDKDKYEATVKFFKDVIGFEVTVSDKDVTIYKLPNGDAFEILRPRQAVEQNNLVSGPKIDFLVDNVAETRKEMEKLGVKFEGSIQHNAYNNYTSFWAPDGYLYGLTDWLNHPGHKL